MRRLRFLGLFQAFERWCCEENDIDLWNNGHYALTVNFNFVSISRLFAWNKEAFSNHSYLLSWSWTSNKPSNHMTLLILVTISYYDISTLQTCCYTSNPLRHKYRIRCVFLVLFDLLSRYKLLITKWWSNNWLMWIQITISHLNTKINAIDTLMMSISIQRMKNLSSYRSELTFHLWNAIIPNSIINPFDQWIH